MLKYPQARLKSIPGFLFRIMDEVSGAMPRGQDGGAESDQSSPPKLSTSTNNQQSDKKFLLDIDQSLKEARKAGVTEEKISRFFADSRRAQVKALLADDSIFENHLDPNDDESTRAERIRALRQAKEDQWVTEHDNYLKEQARRRAQSEKDKTPRGTPNSTPTKERPSTPQGAPDSIAPGDTPPSRTQENKLRRLERQKQSKAAKTGSRNSSREEYIQEQIRSGREHRSRLSHTFLSEDVENALRGNSPSQMSPTPTKTAPVPASTHGPLVDRTRPSPGAAVDTVKENGTEAQLNHEIEKNVEINTAAAAPAEATNKPKKEKAPKQPKAPKAIPAPAVSLTPAVIDLRVGHILRAIEHPNADTMYVSTIAMGDPEGTEHTEVDEQTGKVVRTVCSGLKAYVPLAEMQDRKIVVVANLKPANLRSIKSAAMVLAASPKPEEGADPHSPDRTVELVEPPEGSEAGDKVYFEGWPYGEGKGPEKQLNPKKKMWEALQPGFYTTEALVVAFDAGNSEMEGSGKGELIVEGKGKCTVKTLKGAIVR